MTYKGYVTKPKYSVEDKAIVGKVEGIPDLISFHGESLVEFRTAFVESVDDYLALCQEIGKEPNRTT